MKIPLTSFVQIRSHFIALLVFVGLMGFAVQSMAQTKIRPNSVVSNSHVDNDQHAIDSDEDSYARLEAYLGSVLPPVLPYRGDLTVRFQSEIPANTTTFIKLNESGGLLDALLGGTLGNALADFLNILVLGDARFTVEVSNHNGTQSISRSSNQLFSTDEFRLLTGPDNHYYLAVTPSFPYQEINIENRVASILPLLGDYYTVDVYDVFYYDGAQGCGSLLGTSYSAGGINLSLLNLTDDPAENLGYAIDGDPSTYSSLNYGLLGVGATTSQYFYFVNKSAPGDELKVSLSIAPTLINLDLIDNITITTYNGNTLVSTTPVSSTLVGLDLLGLFQAGESVDVYIQPGAVFDRAEVRLSAVAGVDLNTDFRIHEVSRTAGRPTVTGVDADNNFFICSGDSPTLIADPNNATDVIRWYDAPEGGTPLHTGTNFSPGPISLRTTYYVSATAQGCTEESERVPVRVDFHKDAVISLNGSALYSAMIGDVVALPAATATNETGSGPAPTTQWTALNGAPMSGTTAGPFTSAGVYTYRFSATGSNCTNFMDVTITVMDPDGCSLVANRNFANDGNTYTVSSLIGTALEGSVANPSNAADSDLSTYSTLLDPIGLLGTLLSGETSQTLKWHQSQVAGTPVTVKLGQEYGSVLAVGNGIFVQAYHGTTPVGPAIRVENHLVQLLSGLNEFDFTFIPVDNSGVPQQYNAIKVSLGTGVLSVAQRARVYGAYTTQFGTTLANCGDHVVDVQTGYEEILGSINLATSLTPVTNPMNAVDGDDNTYATMLNAVDVASRSRMDILFNQPTLVGDSVYVKVGVPTGVLDLGVLSSFTIKRYLGSQEVGTPIQSSNSLLSLRILGGGSTGELTFINDVPFDRIEILTGGVAEVLTSYHIYEIKSVPKVDVPNLKYDPLNPGYFIELCEGGSITIPTDECNQFVLYNAATGGSIVTAADIANLSAGDVIKVYVQALRFGCETGDYRQEIEIRVQDVPQPVLDPMGDVMVEQGQSHTLTVSNLADYDAGVTFQWYLDGVLIPGQTGPTYEITSFDAATHAGAYTVIAVDACESVASLPTTLSLYDVVGWKSYVVSTGESHVSGGEEITYTIHVRNNSSIAVEDLIITDRIPTNTTYVAGSASHSGSLASGVLTWSGIDLAPGSTTTVSFKVKAADDLLGVTAIGNVARVKRTTADPGKETYPPVNNDTPNDPDITGTPGTDIPVLIANQFTISKTADEARVVAGTSTTFTLTITHTGPSYLASGSQIKLRERPGAGVTIERFEMISGAGTIAATGVDAIVTTNNVLAPGATLVVRVHANVDAGATGTITNGISLWPPGVPEVDPPVTDDPPGVPVDQITDLAIEKTVDVNSPFVGDNVTFTLTVTNLGPSDATGVVVTDEIPSGYNYVSSTGSVGTYNPATDTWTINDLEAGASATLNVVAEVLASGDYTNTATVTGTEDDPDLSNNTDTPDDPVIPVDNSTSNMSVVRNNALANGVDENEVSVLILGPSGSPEVGVDVTFTYTLPGETTGRTTVVATGTDGRANLQVASAQPGQMSIAATSPGRTISDSPRTVTFIIGPVDHAQSTLVVTKDNAVADGVDKNILTATIVDAAGHPIQGKQVVFNIVYADMSTGTRTITTNAAGLAVLELTSTRAGTVEVAARVDGTAISGSPKTVTFVTGAVNHAQSTLVVTKNNAVADGVDKNILTATIVDGTNNPIAGEVVVFTYTDLEGDSHSINRTTDAAGIAVLELTSEKIGRIEVAATVTGTAISGSPKTVTFVSGPVDHGASTLVITKNNAHADGLDQNRLRATIVDAFHNPIEGANVEFDIVDVDGGSRTVTVTTNASGVADIALTSTLPGDAIVAAEVTGTAISGSPQTVTFILASDLTITKVADQARVVAGTSTTFTITVQNNSAVAIPTGEDILLQERPGTGIVITGFTVVNGPATIAVTGNNATLTTTGSVPTGGRIVVQVTADVLQSATGNITNGIAVWGPDTPPGDEPDDEDDTPPVPVDRVSDLAIEKTVDNNTPYIGNSVVFTLRVTNLGPSDAAGVRVTDQLPTGFAYVASNASVGAYDPATHSWAIGDLAVGEEETLTITARVLATGDYTNIGRVEGSNEDPDLSNNTDSPDDPILPVPKEGLSIDKVANKTQVEAGEAIEFTITITNKGPDVFPSGAAIRVVETPSVGLSITDYEMLSGPATISHANNVVTLTTNADFAVDQTIVFLVKAVVAADAPDHINNHIQVWGPDSDPGDNPDDEETTPDIPVDNDARMSITKVSDQAVVVPGGTATFTLTITNTGPGVLKAGEKITLLERPGEGMEFTAYELLSDKATLSTTGLQAEVTVTEDVPKGGTIQVRVIAEVTAATGTTITNGISVWGPDTPGDDNPDDEDDTPPVPVGDPYQISISKVSDKARVVAGEETSFTVTLTNQGPESVAAGDQIKIRELPGPGLSILRYEVLSGPATVQGSANAATVTTNAAWPKGATIVIAIRTKVDERASGTITNKIQVWGDGKNPDTDEPDGESETPPIDVDSELLIPNLFTPNGDGVNDQFVIKGLLQYDQSELLIINRWGNRVYHAKPYQNNWDGGSLSDGTYFYILTLTKGGQTTVHRGPVAIVRNTGRN